MSGIFWYFFIKKLCFKKSRFYKDFLMLGINLLYI
nr:MAG TPA: hypothetical protein [Caudoviricetes sp.]